MSQQTHDLAGNLAIGRSLVPIARTEATATGTYIDCSGYIGPIQALVQLGASTGSPDATSVVWTLMESNASDGTGATAISDLSATVTQTAAGAAFIYGTRTKQYVAVRAAVDFTGGTSPAVPCDGTLLNPRVRAA